VKLQYLHKPYTPSHHMRSTLPLVIIAIILCVGSGLYAYQQDINENQSSSNQPKSVDYILYPNSGPSFISVLSAIQSRYDNNEKNTFVVGLTNGIYNQSVMFVLIDNSSAFSELFIEFRGLGVSVQIAGDNFLMADSGNLHFKFENISITGGVRGIETYLDPESESLTFLEVENCKIFGNTGTNYGFNVNMDGAGIYAEGPAIITGCEIYNNTGKNYWVSVNGVENFSRGGGIAVVNNSPFETIIENNNIHDNAAIAGGGLYVTGTGRITIKDNLVHSNTRNRYLHYIGGVLWQEQGGAGEGIYCYNSEKLTLCGNVVRNQIPGTIGDRDDMPLSTAVVVESCGYSSSVTSVLIENNSFMDNGNCHGIWVIMPSGCTLIRNNLSCGNKFGIYCSQYDNNLITLTYNNAYQNGTLNGEVINYFMDEPSWITASNNSEFDPKVSSAYAPLWNASVISPLIDTGYPRSYDPDGTPSDIGAIRAGDHKYEKYTMPGPGGIKWMSYPVLNEITNDYCMNGNFFDPILNPQWLQLIQYRPLGYPTHYIYYDGYNGWTNSDDEVNSLQGYKIQMFAGAPSDIKIKTTGYLQAPHTVLPLNQGENWLGYFQETSSKPLDALGPILNYISQIQTQSWTMVKVPGFGWIHQESWVINYGDMVVVNADQACSFSWNNAQPVDPKSVPKSKEFEYTEIMDYIPFYITIPESKTANLPSEIGLYVNGVCKGAAVVENDLTHICAYLDAGEEITSENSILVFFYPSKAIPNSRGIYRMNAGQLSQVKDTTTYYTINITDLDKVTPIPAEALLHQNYPNPFNPSTTIAYDLPEDSMVQINVYNVKGQLVKKLIDKSQSVGSHSIIWNGQDTVGNSCASGVYYYKLTSKGKSITKKMLLMK